MADQKSTGLSDWDDIRFFLALARARTLSAAARRLRVTHATVARRAAALEENLGTPLFERRENGYALTDIGRAVFDAAETMEQAAVAIGAQEPARARLRGVVRITTIASLAQSLLIPGLAPFAALNPQLVLEFELDTRISSLARREADIAVRLGKPRDSGLVGKKLADIAYGFYGAREVQEADAAHAPLIGFDDHDVDLPEARWLMRTFPEARYALRVSGIAAQVEAARAGYGLALLPRHVGDPDAVLKRIDGLAMIPARELWILSPRDLLRSARIRAVFDAITDIAVRQRARIEAR